MLLFYEHVTSKQYEKAFDAMETITILKVTERCQAKLPLFFMSAKQHKNEFLLSEKIKLN